MGDHNIVLPESFLKDLKYKIQKFSTIADKLDILAFEARQVYLALNKAYKDAHIKDAD
ncbi:MAG: hypothetical protein ACD_16C00073G0001 [uncultured bacterium]|nr:MAG: hypothetical protein ACD_16C00073G0001 [uncultured bacterium]